MSYNNVMRLEKYTALGLIVLTVLVGVDFVTLNGKTVVILPPPPTILTSNTPPNHDIPDYSTSINDSLTPPAISVIAPSSNVSISQVAAKLTVTGGTQVVGATTI